MSKIKNSKSKDNVLIPESRLRLQFSSLRPIAQKLTSLLRRLSFTQNIALYKEQIKDIIQYELKEGGAHLL